MEALMNFCGTSILLHNRENVNSNLVSFKHSVATLTSITLVIVTINQNILNDRYMGCIETATSLVSSKALKEEWKNTHKDNLVPLSSWGVSLISCIPQARVITLKQPFEIVRTSPDAFDFVQTLLAKCILNINIILNKTPQVFWRHTYLSDYSFLSCILSNLFRKFCC